MRIQCSQNASDCCTHLREQKWIAQRAKARPQEILNFVGAAKLFPKKQPRDAFRLANLIPRNGSAIQIFARRYDPSVLHWVSLFTAP
jgi:hypothetical protein